MENQESKSKTSSDGFAVQFRDGDRWVIDSRFVFRERIDALFDARKKYGSAWMLTWAFPFIKRRWRVVPVRLNDWR